MPLTKAQLYNADTGAMVVECHFNPNEVSISKSNKWEPENSSGTNLPDVHFKGEGARSLSLTLIFDSYERRADVRESTNKVLGLMDAPEDRSQTSQHARPPHVLFRWGDFETFPAVITQLSQKFTLFLESGLPVRATLTLTLAGSAPAGDPQPEPRPESDLARGGRTPRAHRPARRHHRPAGGCRAWRADRLAAPGRSEQS